jgi:hypothetical protein
MQLAELHKQWLYPCTSNVIKVFVPNPFILPGGGVKSTHTVYPAAYDRSTQTSDNHNARNAFPTYLFLIILIS